MKILDLVQGSDEWGSKRALHDCASEAPVMMGLSKKMSRSELVRIKATGDEREFSQWVRDNLLARGHDVEAFARQRVEADLGEDLYPVTGTDEAGELLASFDGLTMDGETGFECKLWNEELAAAVRAGEVPPSHWPQLEQQIEVGGLKRVIFVVTDGTPERFLSLEYKAIPGRMDQVRAGWKQFHEDVANYKHVEVIPKAVAEVMPNLPAVAIETKGEVELVSNLERFGTRLNEFIKALPTKPSTDQEFANCEQAVKTLQQAQDGLEAAESAALSRFATIDDMRSTVAAYKELARKTRLMLEKLVTARKEEIRDEIRRDGAQAFATHVGSLNEMLGRPYMPRIEARFAEVMKGKKTVVSLRDAVATELARLKIESNAIGQRILANLKLLDAHAEHRFLFADERELVLKECDHFALVVSTRIDSHKAEAEKRAQAERERIRLEEEAKARAAIAASAAIEQPAIPAPANEPIRSVATGLAQVPRPGTRAYEEQRPSDEEIVSALCGLFSAPRARVIVWLEEMDLETVNRRIAVGG